MWYFPELTKALQLEEEVNQIGLKRSRPITPVQSRKATKFEAPTPIPSPAPVFAAPRRRHLGRNITNSFATNRTVNLPARKPAPRAGTPTTVVRTGPV